MHSLLQVFCVWFVMKWLTHLLSLFISKDGAPLHRAQLDRTDPCCQTCSSFSSCSCSCSLSLHQNYKICPVLIWWQAPCAPYEKGVNKTHIGNIKQGQGRQFGWRSFFKCGKQKNKIVLAVAAVGETTEVPATCFMWPSAWLSSA